MCNVPNGWTERNGEGNSVTHNIETHKLANVYSESELCRRLEPKRWLTWMRCMRAFHTRVAARPGMILVGAFDIVSYRLMLMPTSILIVDNTWYNALLGNHA